MSATLQARFVELTRDFNGFGIAVSGGGDSMAMLYLAAAAGLPVRVATVDHGLRPEAAAEAAAVGRICAELGLPHDVLRWHWDGKGNLQDAARRGRRSVLADWAVRQGLDVVALAHTQDDIAETFLMRLARGAGVDGLAAMASRWTEGGIVWVRPLLGTSRAALRDYLRGIGRQWVEDPSNDNDRFDRARARKALGQLAPLGISAGGLAEVAAILAEARAALEAVADAVWARVVRDCGPGVVVDVAALGAEPAEVQRRVLIRVIRRIAPAEYAPRGGAVQALLARLLAGKDGVLAGCRFQVTKGQLWAFREARSVAGLVAGTGQAWDGWRIEGRWPEGACVRALGTGIALCGDWRAADLPRAVLMVSPALWQGDALIAAPHAGFGPGYSAIPLFVAAGLHHSAITH